MTGLKQNLAYELPALNIIFAVFPFVMANYYISQVLLPAHYRLT